MDYNNFFPYESYRDGQEKVIKDLYNGLTQRNNVLFIAPNGTGKTVDNMAAALPIAIENRLKIVYLCRTHTQNARVIEEINKINRKLKENSEGNPFTPISAISLRGRSEMCLHRTVKKMKGSPTDIMNVCADLRKNRNCSYFNKMIQFKTILNADLKSMGIQSTDAQDLIVFCKQKGYCPYFFTKLLLKEVKVIVCNYQWLFNPNIRETFLEGAEIELEKSIIIMDECHNLPDMAAEIDSERLTAYTINQSIKDLEYGRAKEEMIAPVKKWIDIFNSLMKQVKDEEVPLVAKNVLAHYLKLSGMKSINDLRLYMKDLLEYGTAINEEKLSSGHNPIDFISAYCDFLNKFLMVIDDKRYFFTAVPNIRKHRDKSVNIEIICMDPREISSYIFKESYATISCSGTIHADSFKTLLGLDEIGKDLQVIEIKSPFPKRNVKVMLAGDVSTRAADRNDSMYHKICEKISEVLFNTPGNIGIFCASYIVLKGLLANGLEGIVNFASKKLYIENSENSASDNAILIEKFKADASKTGAVLLGVSGGRNSEGEDFPGNFMNAAVIVGFPFHRPTPRVQAKIQYYNSIFNRKGRLFAYMIPAIQRSNQACGRPIRKLDDRGVILLLDFRFGNYMSIMSQWIQDNVEQINDKPNVIANELQHFFAK